MSQYLLEIAEWIWDFEYFHNYLFIMMILSKSSNTNDDKDNTWTLDGVMQYCKFAVVVEK